MTEHTNRLAKEHSPYLLQHAHNPVDWYPWGDEALNRAREEDKPVFLSVGYATCHWCHVMERESFESPEIAALLNEAFICIKVDREERPDIDSIYMTACQVMTGSGGWPMSMFLTPEGKPFHAATYIPPDSRYGRIGMKQLVPRIVEAWVGRRGDIEGTASEVLQFLSESKGKTSDGIPGAELIEAGYRELMSQYDRKQGGFGPHPKFPIPHRLSFLLRTGRPDAVDAVEHTLEEMRKGGIFDHVGFGFHRYSTDSNWLLPHFEKMLYDQALLVLAYTDAYELTGNPFYRQVVQEILTYVLRDMTDETGGFYSAEDADSEGEEGLFYVWDEKELRAALGDDFEFAKCTWNIVSSGNFKDESSGQVTGKNILHFSELPASADIERLEHIRKKLFDIREQRIHPLKDRKILTDWNGLMIAALARAGRILNDGTYTEAARRANLFIEEQMRGPDCRLFHRYLYGNKAVPGHLDDYSFMIFGLLELYETTLDPSCLSSALHYNAVLDEAFCDVDGGGYFMTAADSAPLIVRPKEFYDGALPSGNSIQLFNLFRLARMSGRSELEKRAFQTTRAFGGFLNRSPSGFSQALSALRFVWGESEEVVLVGNQGAPDTEEMLAAIRKHLRFGRTLLYKDPGQTEVVEAVAPFIREYGMMDEKATVYVCRNNTCERPVNSAAELLALMK